MSPTPGTDLRVLAICFETYQEIIKTDMNNGSYCSNVITIIVSITKFSIVIGSPRAYLSRNRRTITWVSNYRCPIEYL